METFQETPMKVRILKENTGEKKKKTLYSIKLEKKKKTLKRNGWMSSLIQATKIKSRNQQPKQTQTHINDIEIVIKSLQKKEEKEDEEDEEEEY